MKVFEIPKTIQDSPRLVLIVPAFPKLSETFIVSKFVGLLERGWDVHLVCNYSDAKDWSAFSQLLAQPDFRERVHVTWPQSPRWLAGLLIIPSLVRGLARSPKIAWNYLRKGSNRFGWDILRRFYLDLELICLKPDIIHFEFGSLAVGRTHLKELLDGKLTVSFRGYDLNFVGLDQPEHYQEIWEQVDSCHFLGEDLWNRAVRRGCPPEMPHKLIPPAIDLSRFPARENLVTQFAQAPGESIKILSVGRLEWKKGYEFALQAIKILKDQGIKCHYQIVGDGEYRDALTFARHQLKLEDTVEFVGGLSHEKVIQALEKTDIFLHSSISEGFCNAVLEAQAMAVPVVCSDAGGLAENVEDGVTGFIVPNRDVQATAAKLTLLSMDPLLRRSMGFAGRVRVESFFQLHQQLDAWESFYEGCL